LIQNDVIAFVRFRQDSIEPINSTKETSNEMELKSSLVPATTTYAIPSKTRQISTQSLLTTSTSSNHNNTQSNSLSWLHRLSNRFNSSTSITRSTSKTSSTGLIFENRPTNLPPKSNEETLKHQNEYQKMCLEARRAQQLYDEKEEQRQRLKLKREEFVSKSLQIWTQEILPCWEKHNGIQNCSDVSLNTKAHKLWWHGLPPRKQKRKRVVIGRFAFFLLRYSRKSLENRYWK